MPCRPCSPSRFVPRRQTIVLGSTLPVWTPPDEAQDPATCHLCGGSAGVIHAGDDTVCLGCLASGADGRLEADLARDRAAEAAESERKAAERRAELLERRRRKAAKRARDREMI